MPRQPPSSSSSSSTPVTTTTATHPTALSASPPWPSAFTDGLPLPKLIVFDLDYTLWPFWVDTHVTPPLKAQKGGEGKKVEDRYGEGFGFYGDVGEVLDMLRQKGIKIGAASRTSAPDLARDMLKLLRIPTSPSSPSKATSLKAIDFFDYLQIYPGSKVTHFERLKRESGVEYEEMLFFDDEARNRNVETLGVVMWLVRDGVSWEEVGRGVEGWRRRNKKLKN